jgi:hypothetical protein
MIRPWYRSRLFWLGLPGLVFMLWLWLAKADQRFAFGHIAITGPGEETLRIIGTYNGSIRQTTIRYSNGTSTGWQRGFHWRGFHGSGASLAPEHVDYFPRPLEIIRGPLLGREPWGIRLAWWVVISAYTAVWLGAVAGWQRRKARLRRRAAAELPGS